MRWWCVVALCAGLGCGGGNKDGADLYRACDVPDDCDEIPEGADAECLDKGGEGFCTWTCETDADCEDDGDDAWTYVCASFENETGKWCFPSCEDPPDTAENECPGQLGCRSTGGGSENRKVCFPEDGATTTAR